MIAINSGFYSFSCYKLVLPAVIPYILPRARTIFAQSISLSNALCVLGSLSSMSNAFRINDLSLEILCETLLLYVLRMSQSDVPHQVSTTYPTKFSKCDPDPPAESMLSPQRLSQVCRLWRNVATSLPSLWTDINVLLHRNNSNKRDAWLVRAADTWTERSKMSPLRLRVAYHILDVPKSKFDTAVSWLHSLSFGTEFASSDNMPQVHLDISCSSVKSLHLTSIPCIRSGQISSLRELTLCGILKFSGRKINVQRADLLEVFRHMPHLEVLKTNWLDCNLLGLVDSQALPITLHRLHTLAFSNDSTSAFIVSKLLLPALRRLILKPFPWDFSEGLSNMIELSQSSLEYLEISNGFYSEDDITPFLRRFTSDLKALCLLYHGPFFLLDFLELLFIIDTGGLRGAGNIRFPNLEELCIKDSRSNIQYARIRDPDLEEVEKRKFAFFCNMLEERCHTLSLIGTIECHPARHSESHCFNIPFVDVSFKQIYRTFAKSIRFDIRFEKL
ncbi:uncharacterized protein FOMMEDRAFT_160540 [Fomitiporia mediterranea MF3/22]|uniref:uncharacterized protein n=1 Tax=Fomitiporia mediterranea (strain MF3/22) TaxID=694068 RepID=UPI0004407C65|nr:uncharacterized protein FOMMEDRAFT_160540 [Fomitiporia mediterranea MF3/22]EJC99482.1 hypothetical protein FOMMEDRAFT_160540 [Fomitiporia mediterranea MF3/22]